MGVGVKGGNGVLVLLLRLLPDLNLTATTDDGNTEVGEEVVGRVGVVVNTTVEDGGGVLADSRLDDGLSAGVLLDKVGNVVDDTSDQNESTALISLGLEVVEIHDGKLFERNTPVELSALAVDLLLELLNATLLDFVLAELLEVVGESELLPGPDAPLGGIIYNARQLKLLKCLRFAVSTYTGATR